MELTPYTTIMGGLTGLPLQFVVAPIATCAFWLFGYDMSVQIVREPHQTSQLISTQYGRPHHQRTFYQRLSRTKNPNVQGIIIAVLELGALIGSTLCLTYGD